jgi:hypothetical protein
MAGVSPKSRGPLPGPKVPGSPSMAQGALAVGCPTGDWGPEMLPVAHASMKIWGRPISMNASK